MKIEYAIDKADFLEYQLYTASKSETVRKTIRRSRNAVPVVYDILGISLLNVNDLI